MNRPSPAQDFERDAPPAAGAAPVDQFTVARIAAVLGRDVRTLRDALAGTEPDGHCLVSGNLAKTYLVSSLPEKVRTSLAELAQKLGFDCPERMLSRTAKRWEPDIPPGEIHPEEIARAKKRAMALAQFAQRYSEGSGSATDVLGEAVTAHKAAFGYEVTGETLQNMFRRVIQRDGGRTEFHRWELYLPEAPKRTGADVDAPSGDGFEHVETYIAVVDALEVSTEDRAFVWTAVCDNLQQLIEAGDNVRRARRRLLAHVFARAPWLCASRQSLGKCFDDKWRRYCAGENFVGDRRPNSSGNHQELPLTEEDKKKLVARGLQGGLARAWRVCIRKGELSAGVGQHFAANPSRKSYVPKRVRELLQPEIDMLQDIHHGPRQAKLNGAYISRDWSRVLPGDWFQSDDCTLVIYYWEVGPDGEERAIRGQWLPLIDVKSSRILAHALHSEANYNARVIRGLILHAHDTYGLPRFGFYFEKGIWKKAKLLKGVADEVPGEDTERGLREHGLKFIHAEFPRGKVIEQQLGVLQTNMEDQPGYIGRCEIKERFERVQKNLLLAKRGKIKHSNFLLHRDEWITRLDTLCEEFNEERQDGRLKGKSPREVWDDEVLLGAPLVKLEGAARHLLANHRRPSMVTKNGICIQVSNGRHWFRNEDTGRLIGRRVDAYFDVEDLSSIWIRHGDGPAIVVPKAPSLSAAAPTKEEFAAAKASCAAHNRPAVTLYRTIAPHFPKNGPSLFRPTITTPEFVEETEAVQSEQAAIKAKQDEARADERKLARYQRTRGKLGGTAVSPDRLLKAYELLEEAEHDEQHP